MLKEKELKYALYFRGDISSKLERVKIGTLKELNNWAKKKKLTFKRSSDFWGGYYKDSDGNTYECYENKGKIIKG